jgi:Concanavalin A-like lectin/glucanases superfamily
VPILCNPEQSAGLHVGLQNGMPSVWFWAQLIGTAIVADTRTSPAGWSHLAFVQQGGAQTLYGNGAQVQRGAMALRSTPVTSFMLGAYDPAQGQDERWTGRIDDVRIYGRALTAAEVQSLFSGAP